MARQEWELDLSHSGIDFSIKHLGFSKVRGCFKQFNSSFEADTEDLTSANIRFEVDLASVDTRNEHRDNHLRSADFFDVENYPTMTFTTTKITKQSDGAYQVIGDLTIRGTTRPASFRVTYGGKIQDPWGNERAAFSAQGTVNRSDYGMTYKGALEMGELLLSNEVAISMEVQVTLKTETVAV